MPRSRLSTEPIDMFGKNSWEDLDTHEKRQAVSLKPRKE